MWRSRWLPFIVLGIGLALDIGVMSALRASTSQRVASEQRAELDAVASAVEFRMRTYGQGLSGVRALVETTEGLGADQFREYVEAQGLLASLPGVQALGWNRLIRPSDTTAYERSMRERYDFLPADYSVGPTDGDKDMMVVEFLEPVEGNEGAFGFNIASEERRAAAVRLTLATGAPASTAPVDLVQDTDSVPGILVLLQTEDDGRTDGVAVAVFRTGDLLSAAEAEIGQPFAVHDIGAAGLPTSEPVLLTEREAGGDPALVKELEVFGRRWLVSLVDTDTATGPDLGPLAGGITGAALAIALALLVAATQRAARRADDRANLLDEDVVAANAELAVLSSRLERGIRAADVLVWEHNVTTGTTWSSAGSDHPEAGVETTFEARLHPDDRTRVMRQPEPGPGELRESEFRLADRQGNYRWVLSRSIGVSRNDEWVVIGAHVDITDQRARVDLVEELVDDLQDRNEALRNFTHIASHDLRSPLRAVASLVSFLREDLPPASSAVAEPHLRRIEERLDRMSKLIEELLLDARAQHDHDSEPVDLDRLIDDVLTTLDPPRHLGIERRLDTASILTVKSPLSTCVRNLISEAIQGPHRHHIRIEAFQRRQKLVMTFTGVNAPDPILHDEPMPSRRGDDHVRSDSALGLAIARRTAEIHGGSIATAVSESGGLTLTLEWPLALSEADVDDAVAAELVPRRREAT